MEKISADKTVDTKFKCCYFGAMRGTGKDGKPVAIVSDVYVDDHNFSHKNFECSFYDSIVNDRASFSDINFDDPEIWKLSEPGQSFEKREKIIDQLVAEKREILHCEVKENLNC
ncbi:MAG: hypothetical protein AAFX87_02820 [Bacteroidota bacterium]